MRHADDDDDDDEEEVVKEEDEDQGGRRRRREDTQKRQRQRRRRYVMMIKRSCCCFCCQYHYTCVNTCVCVCAVVRVCVSPHHTSNMEPGAAACTWRGKIFVRSSSVLCSDSQSVRLCVCVCPFPLSPFYQKRCIGSLWGLPTKGPVRVLFVVVVVAALFHLCFLSDFFLGFQFVRRFVAPVCSAPCCMPHAPCQMTNDFSYSKLH